MMSVLFDGAPVTMSTDQMTADEPLQLFLDVWTEEDDAEYQTWLDSIESDPSER